MTTTTHPATAERISRAVLEQHPNGQPGQPVVERLALELFFQGASVGDVAHRQDDTGDAVFAEQVAEQHLEGQVAALAVLEPLASPGLSCRSGVTVC